MTRSREQLIEEYRNLFDRPFAEHIHPSELPTILANLPNDYYRVERDVGKSHFSLYLAVHPYKVAQLSQKNRVDFCEEAEDLLKEAVLQWGAAQKACALIRATRNTVIQEPLYAALVNKSLST